MRKVWQIKVTSPNGPFDLFFDNEKIAEEFLDFIKRAIDPKHKDKVVLDLLSHDILTLETAFQRLKLGL